VRDFHQNEKTKPALVRFHSLKNQWLMLVKNEDVPNLLKDFPFIFGRELLILGYNLVFSPKTLFAVAEFARLLPRALAKRRGIKSKQATRPRDLRPWLGRSGRPAGRPPEITTAGGT
jgi:hypothetical protein